MIYCSQYFINLTTLYTEIHGCPCITASIAERCGLSALYLKNGWAYKNLLKQNLSPVVCSTIFIQMLTSLEL